MAHQILFRALEPSDAELLYTIENDTEAWDSSETAAPYSLHLLRRYATHYDADPFSTGQLRLVATSAHDPATPLGLLDFYEISLRHSHAWVGIYVRPEFRGRGIASAILQSAARYARMNLRLSNLGARILSHNTTSLHLFTRQGYTLRGTLPSWHFAAGAQHDLHLLTLPLSPAEDSQSR